MKPRGFEPLQLGAGTGDEFSLSGALTEGTAGTFTLEILDAGITSNPTNFTLMTFASTTFAQTNFTLELPTNVTGTLVETSTSLSITDLVEPKHSDAVSLPTPLDAELTGESVSSFNATAYTIPTPEPGVAVLPVLGASAVLGWRRHRSL